MIKSIQILNTNISFPSLGIPVLNFGVILSVYVAYTPNTLSEPYATCLNLLNRSRKLLVYEPWTQIHMVAFVPFVAPINYM